MGIQRENRVDAITILYLIVMFISMILICIAGVARIPIWASCILLVLSVTAVFLKDPVKSEKKPLSQGELQKYKRMARIICIFETCIIVTTATLGVNKYIRAMRL